MERREVDRRITMADQLAHDDGESVVLINTFNVDPAEVDQLLEAWQHDAAYFKSQPGFISTQLHRGIAGSCSFLNYAVWQDVTSFRTAFSRPELREMLAAYPPSAQASPHLFRKIAAPGICVG